MRVVQLKINTTSDSKIPSHWKRTGRSGNPFPSERMQPSYKRENPGLLEMEYFPQVWKTSSNIQGTVDRSSFATTIQLQCTTQCRHQFLNPLVSCGLCICSIIYFRATFRTLIVCFNGKNSITTQYVCLGILACVMSRNFHNRIYQLYKSSIMRGDMMFIQSYSP